MRYDSVHGKFPDGERLTATRSIVGGDRSRSPAERDPKNLPWGDLGIDIVMECTGIFTDKEKAADPPGSRRQARAGLGPVRRAPTRPSSTASTTMC
jgi:glyceraldehyde-3-phosphate dehydrogenase/erythrose-4-phosphate dehydrogenase